MAQMLRNLENIQRSHTHFESDQVLTSGQLNGVIDFLGDAERLTRVNLFGVGIAGGLRLVFAGDRVTLTRGVAVSTDGDLLYVPADVTYREFKPYGEGAPSYAPFGPEESRIAAWELVPVEHGEPLSQFGAITGTSLNDLAVVLLAENWVKDQDVCTGADCDNMGGQTLDDLRVILIPRSAVGPFRESFVTADSLARQLGALVAGRPSLAGVSTVGQLAKMNQDLCKTLQATVSPALSALYPVLRPLLSDLFASDPTPSWVARLQTIHDGFMASSTGIQYYFDLLKDLIDTHVALREALFGEYAVLCPDLTAFPKHVLLGNLTAGAMSDENRTGFYPSPRLSVAGSAADRARFLFLKLEALIANFAVPATGGPVRITPSRGERDALEERAIPYYYRPTGTEVPMHRRWSYTLARRGMSTFNYGYHGAAYGAEGGAAAPLTSQIGRFDFFRIEGHLGMHVSTALAAIEGEIKSKNLPLAVETVMAGADRRKVVPRWPPLYTDFHRLHDVLRYALSDELEDAADYGTVLRKQFDGALEKQLLIGKDAQEARDLAVKSADSIQSSAKNASSKLRVPYETFKKDDSWRQDLSVGLQAAGEMKLGTTKVVKTEFPASTDFLLGSTSIKWIDWVDVLLGDKDDKVKDRQLLSRFAASHPGLEHMGGAPRGGTIVLVYDETSSNVVADFALPYLCCAPEADEPPPPPPKPPRLIPPWVIERPITLLPPIDLRVQDHIKNFWVDTEPKIKEQIAIQKEYMQLYKDSVLVVGGVSGKESVPKYQFDDRLVGLHLEELDLKSRTRDVLHGLLIEPSVDEAERKRLTEEIQHVESEISRLANETAGRVVGLDMSVEAGGDGIKALTEANRHVAMLHNPNLRGAFRRVVGNLEDTTKNEQMRNVLNKLNRPG